MSQGRVPLSQPKVRKILDTTPYSGMGAVLPNTERLAATTLQLTMHPALSLAQQNRVLAALESAATERKR
jgi:dTDP-4-amino-4,6-dideoxygalactose transaminase